MACCLAATALFGVAGCGQAASTPRGWTRHEDPQGFSVQLPAQWEVSKEAPAGAVAFLGPDGEQVVIWPVFIPGGCPAAAAGSVLSRLATRAAPAVQWQGVEPLGQSTLRAAGRAGNRAALALFTWADSPRGAGGSFYCLTAPAARFEELEGTFADILASFQAAGAPTDGTSAAQSALRTARWQDPREGAFSILIPQGWTANGGLFRFAPTDVRVGFEVVSPDGQIRLTGGDAELPTFTEPTQMLLMTGFQEGSWYSPGYGVNMMVRRYMPGPAFAREYVSGKIGQGLEALQIDVRERADAVEAINAIYRQYNLLGMQVFFTAGEARFTGRRSGRPMAGYYFAGTRAVQTGGMGLWNAEFLFGYLAPADRQALAEAALTEMVRSYEPNPQWLAMQQGIAAHAGQVVAKTHAEISNMIQSGYESRGRSDDELSRRRSNAILGVEDVVDPQTGREIKIESGSNYYWMDHRGTIVGTETHTRPDLDFRELVRLP